MTLELLDVAPTVARTAQSGQQIEISLDYAATILKHAIQNGQFIIRLNDTAFQQVLLKPSTGYKLIGKISLTAETVRNILHPRSPASFKNYCPREMASCRDCPCEYASCREPGTAVWAGRKKSRTVSAEGEYDGQSQQETKTTVGLAPCDV